MDGLQKIMARISTIEQRFGSMTAPGSASFADTLGQAQDKQKYLAGSGSSSGSGSHREVENIVRTTAAKYNLDPKLALAVATAESSLEPGAVSPAGAAGVMQLMPETAQSLGVQNVFDPKENVDGGIRYLCQLLNTFGGDTTKAVAAYNAGPEAVKQYCGVPPYAETREYVDKVINLSR